MAAVSEVRGKIQPTMKRLPSCTLLPTSLALVLVCAIAQGQPVPTTAQASAPASASASAPASAPARYLTGAPVCESQRLDYPAAARRAGATGTTGVELMVAPDGKILETRVLTPSGTTPEHQLLDQAALALLSRCRMQMPPGTSSTDGPRPARLEYAWRLEGPASAPSVELSASSPEPRPPGKLACTQRPEYPAAARRANATGTTRVEMTLMPDGRVLDVRLARSSGTKPENELLDRVTVESMVHCRIPVAPGTVVGDEPRTSAVEYVWALDGVPRSSEPSLEAVTQSAESGDAEAQVQLAARLSAQRPRSNANEEKATQWYKRAADQGSAKALMKLGERARTGVGAPQSFEQSIGYYRRAAELGERDANYWVADAFAKGRGVAVDPKQALAWHLRAAAAGYTPSLLLAGDLCRDASPAEPKRALMYYLIGDRILREALNARKGSEPLAVPAQWQRDADIARLRSQLGDAVAASVATTAAAWTRGQPLPE